MIRTTTTATLNTYRYNLQRSTYTMNKAQNTVMTGRKFNTFAEDPATATRSFQLRRSYLRAESQYEVGESVVKKYEVAWSTLESVLSDVQEDTDASAKAIVQKAQSDTTAAGRNALGQSLSQLAQGVVQTMNGRYGENYVFSGADGLTLPFTWETDAAGKTTLCYRGTSVDVKEGTDEYALLDYMNYKEAKYADLGLGLEEDENGNIIDSSATNVALQGITYLGYGLDDDGDPKNIASIMYRMGEILQNCDGTTGNFATADEEKEFYRLAEKYEDAASLLSDKHVELDTQAKFLKSNQEQLENLTYTLNEQMVSIEEVDLADAITSYSWAQYCYNAALSMGSSVLTNTLMDYLNK